MLLLTVNQARRRIEMTSGDFVDVDVLIQFERDLRDGVATILRDSPHLDLLVCLEGSGPASQAASAKMKDTFDHLLDDHLRKAAHVGFSPLAAMQLRRVTDNDPRLQFFADRPAAEAWLDE